MRRVSEQTRTGALILVFGIFCAALLALPGKTVVTRYLHDLLIFLDGAHRVLAGQVPNIDFHSALGPLAYLIPAAGAFLTGGYGLAATAGTALFVIGFSFPLAYVCASRLRPLIALPFAAFMLALAAVPLHLGDPLNLLSFGMFYNRLGWVLIGTLLVLYLPPRDVGRHRWPSAIAAAVLTLTMIYLKASYGAVAVGFLVGLVAVGTRRRFAALSLVMVCASAVLIEVFWRGSLGYLADLQTAADVSGPIRDGWMSLIRAFLRNLADYVVFGLIAGAALWQSRRIDDAAFYVFCAGAGLLLLNQNYQEWGIITLAAGIAVAAELMARRAGQPGSIPLSLAAPYAPALFIAPTLVHCLGALGLHAAVALSRPAEPAWLPGFDGLVIADLWTGGDYAVAAEYIGMLQKGAAVLEANAPAERVMVVDFVSPFSAGLGLTPPRGDAPWYHSGRTFNERIYPAADEYLRDVAFVMQPKKPIEGWTSGNLWKVLEPYISREFTMAADTPEWTLYRRTGG